MATPYRLRWRQGARTAFVMRIAQSSAEVVATATGAPAVAVIVGPPGPPGEGERYEHAQPSASDAWTVNHNLGVRPVAVSIRSTGGVEVEAQITHVSDNQCVINFAVPFAGTAHII